MENEGVKANTLQCRHQTSDARHQILFWVHEYFMGANV